MNGQAMKDLMASTRAEALRLRKWPAFWIILGTWLTLNLVFSYLFNFIGYNSDEQNTMADAVPKEVLLQQMMPGAVPEVFTQGMAMFGGALMLILGALVTGSGYGWGTWKTALTQGPSRFNVVAGAMIALAVTVVALVVVAFVSDVGAASVIAMSQSQPITMPGLGQSVRGIVSAIAILGMWTLAGVVIGAIARGPALAVGLGLVWVLVVENLLRGVSGVWGPLETVTNYLPGTAAGSLAGSMQTVDGPAAPGVLDILSGTESLVLLGIYAVVFAAGTVLLIRRRDLA